MNGASKTITEHGEPENGKSDAEECERIIEEGRLESHKLHEVSRQEEQVPVIKRVNDPFPSAEVVLGSNLKEVSVDRYSEGAKHCETGVKNLVAALEELVRRVPKGTKNGI